MRVCGKALPPRAALLLTFDFTNLVLITPLLFMVPEFAVSPHKPLPGLLLGTARLMLAGLAAQAIFYYNELYNLQVVRRPSAVLVCVLRTFALLFLFLACACLAVPALAPVLSRVLLFCCVLAFIAISSRLLALPRKREQVLLLSTAEQATDLQETMLACPEWNMEVVEILHPSEWPRRLLQADHACANCDRIIVSDTEAQTTAALDRLLAWKLQGMQIEDAQGFYERATGRVRVERLTPGQFIFSYNYQNGAAKRRLKRLFDLLAASALLLLFSPIIVLVALLVWSQRDGAIIFRQQRVGQNGLPFNICKFRTMRAAEAGCSARWAAQEGHRITRVGAFLRKYRLDELLQLFNIVKGEMSLVGPRPEQPEFCRLLQEQIPFYEQRHSVLPGLTGWAQVRYHYGSSIEESRRKLEFDLFYVKHLSLWLDCAILIETVKVVVVGRGAR